MGRFTFTFEAGRAASELRRMSEKMPGEMQRTMVFLGEVTEPIYAQVAPRRTGRLARGIRATTVGLVMVVRAVARNPETGYDYVGVTRFGHRVSRIYARSAQALRFTVGGQLLLRKSVRGYHPASDWAERGHRAADQAAEIAARRFGERVVGVL